MDFATWDEIPRKNKMAIPIHYNTRNLRLRLGTTVMTALGIALTVAVAILIMALLNGLHQAFLRTGDPLNIIVLRKGTQTELQSSVDREAFQTVKFLPGIARSAEGTPLVSGEMVVVIVLPREDGTGEGNVNVRGMSPEGLQLRPDVKLVEGRWFTPGQHEVAVSKSVRDRFQNANIGQELHFGKGPWKIVGIFDAGQTAFGSEIWTDVNQMFADFNRETFTSILAHASDAIAADGLKNRMTADQRLKLDGKPEPAYYAEQTRAGAPIQLVGTIVAILMGIGSCFAAMNTMYAAVANRSKEIATLRVLGFTKGSILISFLIESVLLSLIGAAIGILLMLPLNGATTGTNNALTFSEIIFKVRIDSVVAIAALIFAVLMGTFGGIAPAWHAAHRDILSALRD